MKPDRWNRAHFAQRSCVGKMVIGFTGFILALSIAAGSAWSVEGEEAPPVLQQASLSDMDSKANGGWTLVPAAPAKKAVPLKAIKNSSAGGAAVAGGCPSMLETARHTPQKPSADDDPRPEAGAAAILGYALGMRYALTPPRDASLAENRSNGACS